MRVVALVSALCCFVAFVTPGKAGAINAEPFSNAPEGCFPCVFKNILIDDLSIQIEPKLAWLPFWSYSAQSSDIVSGEFRLNFSRHWDRGLCRINTCLRASLVRGAPQFWKRTVQGEFCDTNGGFHYNTMGRSLSGVRYEKTRFYRVALHNCDRVICLHFGSYISPKLLTCRLFCGLPQFVGRSPQGQSEASYRYGAQEGEKPIMVINQLDRTDYLPEEPRSERRVYLLIVWPILTIFLVFVCYAVMEVVAEDIFGNHKKDRNNRN